MVQWLRLCDVNVRGMGSIRGQRTKMPHAMWCSAAKIFLNNKIKCIHNYVI